MATNLAPALFASYTDSNGHPLSGGMIYSYQAGTTTPQTTYTDSTGGTPNANPVVLDASGRASIWLDPALSYKFVLKDSTGALVDTIDNVIGTLAAGSVTTATIQDGSITRAKLAAGAVSNLGVVTKNAVFTAAVTDDIYLCDTSSGAYIATLPTAIGNSGKQLTLKKTTNDTNALTVKGNGAETIDGVNTFVIQTLYDAVTVVSNGSNWIIANKIPDPNSMGRVVLNTQNGNGSTNTTVRRFSTVVENVGSDITYADSATLGATFTINNAGIYAINYGDAGASGGNWGLTLNSTGLSTNIATLTPGQVLMIVSGAGGDVFACASVTKYFAAGDVIRAQTDGGGATANTTRTHFLIQRIL